LALSRDVLISAIGEISCLRVGLRQPQSSRQETSLAIPAYLPRQRVSSIENCKKPPPNPAFPANLTTRSSQFVPLSQRYPNSRITIEAARAGCTSSSMAPAAPRTSARASASAHGGSGPQS
jgi:hypothetical protein